MHEQLQSNSFYEKDTEPVLAEPLDATEPTPSEATILFNGKSFSSDKPLKSSPFVENSFSTIADAQLKTSELDELPLGVTTISGFDKSMIPVFSGGENDEVAVSRTLEVLPTQFGKAITIESTMKSPNWTLEPGTNRLMENLGFISQPGEIIAMPTPESVLKAAAAQGVDIQFFPNDGQIASEAYLIAFAAGKYPVATGHPAYYRHDIEDDHITTMVLGGKPLKDALSKATSRMLGEDATILNEAAGNVDTLTATLRAITSPHSQLAGSQYGKEQGRRTFHKYAESLGISKDDADHIITTAQEKAREFGMNTTELD